MKESIWGYYLISFGILIFLFMFVITDKTSTDQQDYYLAKEISNAAMYDAIDFGYYKKYGELKINKEKFAENFVRRFSEAASLNKTYKVRFYTIYETPPAASIELISQSEAMNLTGGEDTQFGVVTRITAILELKNENE